MATVATTTRRRTRRRCLKMALPLLELLLLLMLLMLLILLVLGVRIILTLIQREDLLACLVSLWSAAGVASTGCACRRGIVVLVSGRRP